MSEPLARSEKKAIMCAAGLKGHCQDYLCLFINLMPLFWLV